MNPAEAQSFPLDRDAPLYVAGHRGLVGSAVWRRLECDGFTNLIGKSSQDLDLTDRDAVFTFFRESKPSTVVLAAAKVGGIRANATQPAEFLSVNLRIELNVLDAALAHDVDRLLFLGSSCIYPKFAPQPISEDRLLTGSLEPTNEAYAIAKIAGILHVRAARHQYDRRWISAMPTNLYGPGDNFSEHTSHVLPAMIRRYDEGQRRLLPVVTNWGTGTPRREFLHVDDLARACLHLLENYDDETHVNVGTGRDHSLHEVAELVADTIGYEGVTRWDTSRPDGTPRKLLDVSLINSLGWKAQVDLAEGIASTVRWYQTHRDVER